jgi:DnaJ-class molecular chaperone
MDNLFRVSQGGPGRSRSANGTDENGLSLEEACEVLGIDMTAKLPEIRKKFRTLMKELHPDIRMGDRSKEGQMRKILAAYEVLKQRQVTS